MNICTYVYFFSQYTYINVFARRNVDSPNGRKYAKNGTKVCSFFTTNDDRQKAVY